VLYGQDDGSELGCRQDGDNGPGWRVRQDKGVMDICWDRMVVVIMGVGQYEDNDQGND